MQFNEFGNPDLPKILLLHGTLMTWKLCFNQVIESLSKRFFLIVPAFNGHDPNNDSIYSTIQQETDEIEKYLIMQHDSKLYGAYGISMGGTVLINLLSKDIIQIDKAILDAAFCAPMGMFASISSNIMASQLMRLTVGKGYSPFMKLIAGANEDSAKLAKSSLYTNIKKESIKNAALSSYRFTIPKNISQTKTTVVYWHGGQEPFAAKSAKNLKELLPNTNIRIFGNYGHGELITWHPQQFIFEFNHFFV